jgi:hypothetical protein
VNALRRSRNDALRAYHLKRVTSKFPKTISPEGARRLVRLLTLDDDATQKE